MTAIAGNPDLMPCGDLDSLSRVLGDLHERAERQEQTAKAILEMLSQIKSQLEPQSAAVRALAKKRSPETCARLAEAARRRSPEVRKKAAETTRARWEEKRKKEYEYYMSLKPAERAAGLALLEKREKARLSMAQTRAERRAAAPLGPPPY